MPTDFNSLMVRQEVAARGSCERSQRLMRVHGLLPGPAARAPEGVVAGLEHLVSLRIGVILEEGPMRHVLVCSPLNPAATGGLVAHQPQNGGGHVFQNGREADLAGPAQGLGGLVFLQERLFVACRALRLGLCGAGGCLLPKPVGVLATSFSRHGEWPTLNVQPA